MGDICQQWVIIDFVRGSGWWGWIAGVAYSMWVTWQAWYNIYNSTALWNSLYKKIQTVTVQINRIQF